MKRHHIPLLLIALAGAALSFGCNSAPTAAPEAAQAASAPQQPAAAAPQVVASHVGNAAAGKTEFEQTCSACHGAEGKGLPHLGKDLTTSAFVKSQSDDQLLNFIKHGRAPGEPGNTTGVAMPPKGGNPALSDDQIKDIIAHLRTINH